VHPIAHSKKPALFGIPHEDSEHVLAHTETLWAMLRGSRIFITGGTGFFGKWLLAAIAAANDRLSAGVRACVLCRNPDAFLASQPAASVRNEFSWLRGDVRSFAAPPGSFPVVLHAATPASEVLNLGQPAEMFDIIVAGTRRVLEFAGDRHVDALLLTSSGAVYGRQPSNLPLIPESLADGADTGTTHSAYAAGKCTAEALATTSGLPVKIARGFAFLGPHLPFDTHFAVGNFLRDALRGGPILVRSDGTPVRSYLHAADLAIWLLHLVCLGQPRRPYNVGSEQAVSLAELAHAISLASGHVPVTILQQARDELPERYVPDTRRAREELGLEVRIPLTDALRRTLAWAQSQAARQP